MTLGTELFRLGEKGIEQVFLKTQKTKNKLLTALNQKNKELKEKKKTKQKVSNRLQEVDAEITVAERMQQIRDLTIDEQQELEV